MRNRDEVEADVRHEEGVRLPWRRVILWWRRVISMSAMKRRFVLLAAGGSGDRFGSVWADIFMSAMFMSAMKGPPVVAAGDRPSSSPLFIER